MHFARLQRLGEPKFRKIVNELARGAAASEVARLIQDDWGDLTNVKPPTLVKQLSRLRVSIHLGHLGQELFELAGASAAARIRLFHGTSLNCLDELVELLSYQKLRYRRFVQQEADKDKPMPELNRIIKTYVGMLVIAQNMKFDLGLDECRRGFTPKAEAQRSDALAKAEEILDSLEVM